MESNIVTSGLNLSIPTSHALETYLLPTQPPYDPTRIPPVPTQPLTYYNELYINVMTLHRNMVGSIEGGIDSKPTDLVDLLLGEMNNISTMVSIASGGVTKAIFYACSYRKIFNDKKISKYVRGDNTPLQQKRTSLINKTMTLLLKEDQAKIELHTNQLRPAHRPKALILTHMPYDLISHKYFTELTLLESHTGATKTRTDWYTKLYPVKNADMSHLPFIGKILLIFGDRILFRPNQMKLRRELVDLSLEKNWNALSSEVKVTSDIKTHKDPNLFLVYQDLPTI